MQFILQLKALLHKELLLEWRQKYALNGILLYVAATVFIIYISVTSLSPALWNILFWIIILFTSVNAVAKSFLQESSQRQLYYYYLVKPEVVIVSKTIYNTLLMLLISGLTLAFYSITAGNPVQQPWLFLLAVLLGSTGFSIVFTLISAIVSKAGNSTTLMAVLSFPIVLPMLLMLIKVSEGALLQHVEEIEKDILTLAALDMIMFAAGYLLFPYLWRD